MKIDPKQRSGMFSRQIKGRSKATPKRGMLRYYGERTGHSMPLEDWEE